MPRVFLRLCHAIATRLYIQPPDEPGGVSRPTSRALSPTRRADGFSNADLDQNAAILAALLTHYFVGHEARPLRS